MTRADVEERAASLRRARTPYVHARVVLAERPTSAKPGDEAIVLSDGTIEGFVGGTCAETTVRAVSLSLLDSRESLLLRITPTPEPEQPGKRTVVNECLSGGTFEVFLEPVMPPPVVSVVGDTPIGRALTRVGTALGWEVVPWSGEVDVLLPGLAPGPADALVVASHGRDEEQALAAALLAGVPYVGLVASRKRGAVVVGSLEVPEALRRRVRTPAGLDLGARTAEEIALSILAEIVAVRREPAAAVPSPRAAPEQAMAGTAVDPVCGMEVATVEASLHLDHEGTRWWFCGSGCLRAFVDDPASYVRAAG